MTKWADIARRAAEVTGSADELAERILTLMDAPPGESPAEKARRLLEHEAIQHHLAAEFGQRNGWKPGIGFSPSMLARRAIFPRRNESWTTTSDTIDHPYFYRADRRAAAIAAHLYHGTARRQGIVAWAEHHNLTATFPTDFPSWWYPGATTLVVYEPATNLAGAGRGISLL
jgi:hypothetical protein